MERGSGSGTWKEERRWDMERGRRTNVLLVGIFENAQKRHFGRFWWLITFFCVFSKIMIKITFVCLLF